MADKEDGEEKNYQCLECYRVMTFEQVMGHHQKTGHRFKRVNNDLTPKK